MTENQDHGDVKNDELIAYKAIRKYKLFKKKIKFESIIKKSINLSKNYSNIQLNFATQMNFADL